MSPDLPQGTRQELFPYKQTGQICFHPLGEQRLVSCINLDSHLCFVIANVKILRVRERNDVVGKYQDTIRSFIW